MVEIKNDAIVQTLTVNEINEYGSFDFVFYTLDHTFYLEDNGDISVFDLMSEKAFTIPAPFVTDAHGINSTARFNLEQTSYGWLVTIIMDTDWISDGERALPLKISAPELKLNLNTPIKLDTSGDRELITVNTRPADTLDYVPISGKLKFDTEKIKEIPQVQLINSTSKSTAKKISKNEDKQLAFKMNESSSGSVISDSFDASAFSNSALSFSYDTVTGVNVAAAVSALLTFSDAFSCNPSSRYETFSSEGIKHKFDVQSFKHTAIFDLMSVNSQIMPLSLQAIYSPGLDDLRRQLFSASHPSFAVSAYGKDTKLNFEQYLISCTFDDYGTSRSGYLYFDGEGIAHKLVLHHTPSYYLCKTCNLNYSNGWIGIDNKDYLYFTNGRLSKIRNDDNKTIMINYNSNGTISKIYNCVNPTPYNSPSTQEAQSITISYSNNKIYRATSNYSDYIQFSFDSSSRPISFAHKGRTIARIDHSVYSYDIFDADNNGYMFYTPQELINWNSVWMYVASETNRTIYGLHGTTGNIQRLDIIYFIRSTNTAKVIYKNASTNSYDLQNNYTFNNKKQCISQYSDYSEPQTTQSKQKSIMTQTTWREQTYNSHTKSFNYTEDLGTISNGTFDSTYGNNPSYWDFTDGNSMLHYEETGGNKAMQIHKGETASIFYSHKQIRKTDYVLSFKAKGYCSSCSLRVAVTPMNQNSYAETFPRRSEYAYYSLPVFDYYKVNHNGYLYIKNNCNYCSTYLSVKIDDVSISPVDSTTYSIVKPFEETLVKVSTPEAETETKYDVMNRKVYTYNKDRANNYSETTNYTYNDDINYNHQLIKEQTGNKKVEYTYNSVGLPTKIVSSNNVSGSTTSQATLYEYDQFGNVIKHVSPDGVRSYYKYGINNTNYRLLKSITCNQGDFSASETHNTHNLDYIDSYSYDTYGRAAMVSNGYGNNSFGYGSSGQRSYNSPNFYYDMNVNSKGLPDNVYRGGTKIKYSYDNNNLLSQKEFLTSSTVSQYADYGYDSYGDVDSITYSTKTKDANGNITNTVTDDIYTFSSSVSAKTSTVNSNGLVYNYQSFDSGSARLRTTLSGNGFSGSYTYTPYDNGLPNSIAYQLPGLSATAGFSYTDDWKISGMTDRNHSSYYTYDALDRLKDYDLKYSGTEILDLTYGYETQVLGGTSSGANRVYTITDNNNSAKSLRYSYDATGNMNKVYVNNALKHEYGYNRYGLLTYENNQDMLKAFNYYYDSSYNITSVSETSIPTNQTATTTYSYTSGILNSYTNNGTTKYIVYNNFGNPVKYSVAGTSSEDNMAWSQGGKLKSGTYKNNVFAYKYDANGDRYLKEVNGNETKYYMEQGRIKAEDHEDKGLIYYTYDATGIAGMVYNGSTYFFRKNVLGDVTEILSNSSTVVASYKYDAWGTTQITNSTSANLGSLNPFRYRGYYQDDETGFYYLQTRFYDPAIRRFISADNPELAAQLAGVVGQLNPYAYCNNNPVMMTDPSGQGIFLTILIAALITGAVAGGAVGGTIAYNNAVQNGYSGWGVAGRTIGGIFVGAFAGATAAAGAVTLGYSLIIGGAAIIGTSISASLIQATALGMAIFTFGGTVISSIIGAVWEGPEWPSGPDYPTQPVSPPIGNVKRLSSSGNSLMKYYLV